MVQIANGKYNLHCDKLNLILRKPPDLLQMVKQLAALHIVHHKVNSVIFLKYEVHFDDKRVVYAEHDYLLQLDFLYHILLNQVIFIQAFYCVIFSCAWEQRQENLPKCTPGYKLYHFKVFQGNTFFT